MFEVICRGGAGPKSVTKLMELTGYNRIEVSQLAGRLADQQLVHKAKIGTNTQYSKDRFYAANRQKILRYASDPEALKKLPTKVSPRANVSGPIKVAIQGIKIRVKQIMCDDVDQFRKVKKVKTAPKIRISESSFKKGIQRIIGQPGTFKDWGGESNDLYTTKVMIDGRRIPTAFAFKGPGKSGPLTPAKLGKNGDQIQRLFAAPADLFVVQYHDQVAQSVVEQMEAFAKVTAMHGAKAIAFMIIDGDDSNRLMAAYPKQFGIS
ncbi:hypothetical protein [Bradyrhizobium sp. SZCCHNR2026]|uniref:hypothetical protein n=1 Tax=Bradyrhizobium sp. SZCCHNR2026 TaxID=3057381 RepID=UPI00291662DB|nr:hypothetical protein [Bradyrhizobium sp. SZCCHNR2026]